MRRFVRRLLPHSLRTALIEASRWLGWQACKRLGPPGWRQARMAAHPYVEPYLRAAPVSTCMPYALQKDPFSGGLAGFRLAGSNWASREGAGKPVALMIGFNSWKLGFMAQYLPEYRCAFLPGELPDKLGRQMAEATGRARFSKVFSWGMSAPDWVHAFAARRQLAHVRVEDGFLRSAALGAHRTCPQSLVFDSKGIHYVHSQASDLEDLLNTFAVDAEAGLRAEAGRALAQIRAHGLTKYTLPAPEALPDRLRDAGRQHVLVPGQVSGDMSVRHGNPDGVDVRQMLDAALAENPDADIWFKPHPDMLAIGAEGVHTLTGPHDRVHLLGPEANMAAVLEAVSAVYTLTSLTGMEALVRGKSVTVFGTPFYAGWGLTDDRSPMARRRRHLDMLELFAITYMIYPRYLASPLNSRVGIFEAIRTIAKERDHAA